MALPSGSPAVRVVSVWNAGHPARICAYIANPPQVKEVYGLACIAPRAVAFVPTAVSAAPEPLLDRHFPNHVLPRPVFGADGTVQPLHAQCHADTLCHQRQELLIVLVESAGDEHFERNVSAGHRLRRLPQDRERYSKEKTLADYQASLARLSAPSLATSRPLTAEGAARLWALGYLSPRISTMEAELPASGSGSRGRDIGSV